MPYHRPADRYTRDAHKRGFVARSVFKLEEIDRRAKLLRPGMSVLDLGAAPGSWTQFAAQRVGAKGSVLAVDIVPLRIAALANVRALQFDVIEGKVETLAEEGPFDVVMSDMAPHTTGIPDGDVARSEELVERALHIARAVLKPGGSLLAKIFQGSGFEVVRAQIRAAFREVRVIRPEATRKESREMYLVALGRKPESAP